MILFYFFFVLMKNLRPIWIILFYVFSCNIIILYIILLNIGKNVSIQAKLLKKISFLFYIFCTLHKKCNSPSRIKKDYYWANKYSITFLECFAVYFYKNLPNKLTNSHQFLPFHDDLF